MLRPNATKRVIVRLLFYNLNLEIKYIDDFDGRKHAHFAYF